MEVICLYIIYLKNLMTTSSLKCLCHLVKFSAQKYTWTEKQIKVNASVSNVIVYYKSFYETKPVKNYYTFIFNVFNV